MTDFATAPGAPLTSMTLAQMAAGFACGNLDIDKLNWVLQQLFAARASYVSCAGAPIVDGAAIPTCVEMDAAVLANRVFINPGTSPLVVTGDGLAATPYTVGLDMTALISALCADQNFVDCVTDIIWKCSPVATPPGLPALSPFTDANVTATPL